MTAKQIQHLIAKAVKAQLSEDARKICLYTNPYTKRIDALCMPYSCQPLNFHYFHGNRNRKQHVAHFTKTFNNASIDANLVIKQFI